MLSGDMFPLEVEKNRNILYVKDLIKEEKKIDENSTIKLLSMDGEELDNKDIIKDKLGNEDMVILFIETYKGPPFKNKKLIKLKSKHPINKTTLNPVYVNKYMLSHSPFEGTMFYQGSLTNFLNLPGVLTDRVVDRETTYGRSIDTIQEGYLQRFRDDIKRLGFGDLVHVYAVYNIPSYDSVNRTLDIIQTFQFKITNKDASIVYSHFSSIFETIENDLIIPDRLIDDYVIINGSYIPLLTWFKYTDSQKIEALFWDDENQEDKEKNTIEVYIKTLSGDMIPLEVEKNRNILYIKDLVRDELKIDEDSTIKLFNVEGEELDNKDIIETALNENDTITILTETYKGAPFKGKSKIIIKSVNPSGTEQINNPVFIYKNGLYNNKDKIDLKGVMYYEGSLTKFLELPGVVNFLTINKAYYTKSITYRDFDMLDRFRDDIKRLGFDDLVHVYSVYNIGDKPIRKVYKRENSYDCIITNEDASIVYGHSIGHNENHHTFLIINGILINLKDWICNYSDKDKLKFLNMI